jgi:hypothetical protein
MLNGVVGTEGSEEVGEEGALGWHCVVHEVDLLLSLETERGEGVRRGPVLRGEVAESSDCGVDPDEVG